MGNPPYETYKKFSHLSFTVFELETSNSLCIHVCVCVCVCVCVSSFKMFPHTQIGKTWSIWWCNWTWFEMRCISSPTCSREMIVVIASATWWTVWASGQRYCISITSPDRPGLPNFSCVHWNTSERPEYKVTKMDVKFEACQSMDGAWSINFHEHLHNHKFLAPVSGTLPVKPHHVGRGSIVYYEA